MRSIKERSELDDDPACSIPLLPCVPSNAYPRQEEVSTCVNARCSLMPSLRHQAETLSVIPARIKKGRHCCRPLSAFTQVKHCASRMRTYLNFHART
jgi:hypothetical protein